MIEDILQSLFGLGIPFLRSTQETGKNGKTNFTGQWPDVICRGRTMVKQALLFRKACYLYVH